MLTHKFCTLIEIRKQWTSLTNKDMIKIGEFMAKNEDDTLTPSSLFKQLYNDGESNTHKFLEDVLNFSIELNEIRKNNNINIYNVKHKDIFRPFDCIAESLFCKIGSFLPIKDILTQWVRINRKFCQIGLKSETINEWDFRYADIEPEYLEDEIVNRIDSYPPQFSFNSIVNRIKLVNYNAWYFSIFLDPSYCKSMKEVQILDCPIPKGFYDAKIWSENNASFANNIEKLRLLGSNIPLQIANMHNKLFDFESNSNKMKQIIFDVCGVSGNDINEINQFLQVLFPLSRKEIELKHRLKTEINDSQRNSYSVFEWMRLEEMEKKIKEEVELKYNPKNTIFDLNNINVHADGTRANEWHSPIEMLSFLCFHQESETSENIKQSVSDQLTRSRVQKSLSNLRSVSVHCQAQAELFFEGENVIFDQVISAILNNLTYQLTSLHINDKLEGLEACMFASLAEFGNDSNEKKQCVNQYWFPGNVEHLCLNSEHREEPDGSHLWHKIDSNMFPKLKHIIICNKMDLDNWRLFKIDTDKTKIIENMISLINNGLESMHVKFEKLTFANAGTSSKSSCMKINDQIYTLKEDEKFGTGIASSIEFFKQLFYTYNKECKTIHKKKQFIFKLEYELYLPSNYGFISSGDNGFDEICQNLRFIWKFLNNIFENAMFCFKIIFKAHCKKNENFKWDIGVLENVLEEILDDLNHFGSIKLPMADSHIEYSGCHSAMQFAAVFKNNDSQYCHMDPKYEYSCDYCKRRAWISFD